MRDRPKRKLLQAVRETQAHQTMKSVAFSLIQAGDLRVYSAHLCGRAAACADTRLRVILQSCRWVLQLELEMRQPRGRNVTAFSECFPIWNSHLLFLFFSSNAGSNHAAATAAVIASVSDPSQQAVNKKGTNPLQIFIWRSYFYSFVEVGVHVE